MDEKKKAQVEKVAPEKAPTKEVKAVKEVVLPQPIQYIHIDEFLEVARMLYPDDMNAMTIAGFTASVAPNKYFQNEEVLLEKLRNYLNK